MKTLISQDQRDYQFNKLMLNIENQAFLQCPSETAKLLVRSKKKSLNWEASK